MTTPASSSTRLAVAAGAIGLVGGLVLGATGLAGAASPGPDTPQAKQPAAPVPGAPAPEKRPGRGGGGLVTAISESALTIRTPQGPKTFALNGSTAYYDGKDKSTRAAVEVGDVVHVRAADPRATSPVAATVVVLPAHIAGWVTGNQAGVLTVTDHDGFTRTIRTTASTTVTKDGAASSVSAITVGSFIRAIGDVASDGTSLDAERVVLGAPKDRPGRPGPGGRGFGHRGPGGPGGPGAGPGAPAAPEQGSLPGGGADSTPDDEELTPQA